MLVLLLETRLKVVVSSKTTGAAVPKLCPEIVIWFGVTP
jgi:hypothetical protein